MEEKERLEWTVEPEEEKAAETAVEAETAQAEEAEGAEKAEGEIDREALADYVISVMPQELAELLKKGVAPADAVAKLENERLKKENRQLKAKLDRQEKKAPDLTGQGGMQEKDPFAMGFLQAMNNY